MTWNEWILVIGIVLGIFFISRFVRVRLKPKTYLIVSLISFLILITWVIISGPKSNLRTGVLILFALTWADSWYRKYRQANNQKINH